MFSIRAETMRHLALLVPSLAMVLLTPRAPESVFPVMTSSAPPASRVIATPNPNWMAEVNARIRDGSHQFFVHPDGLRAEVPERGVTARFDDGGAHIASVNDAAAPVTVRTTRLGRAGATHVILATAPGLGDCQDGKVDPEGHCIPRLEYASGGLTEWWEGGTAGFEQGWVLAERPTGDGPVQIDVEVGHADATVDGVVVKLRGDDGSTFLVSGLKAWDARGDDVPARFERAEDGFRVVVDDAGAVYPVEVDPVYTSADWTVDGVGGLGYTLAGAGDTNGDGYDDVLVGSGSGAYLFEGSSTGVERTAAATLESGGAIDGVGDVNGDGYDDVVSGMYGSGSVHVYYGGYAGLSSAGTIPCTRRDGFGFTVSGAGDVNGDGYDDVLVGAPDSEDGAVYFYLGSSAGLASVAATTLIGDQSWSHFGSSLSGAGDVNGDGYDDVVVGADDWGYGYGYGYVFLGASSGLASTATATLQGVREDDDFAQSVSGAGDVNGDGYDDVVIGAPDAGGPNEGRAYIYGGSSTGTVTTVTTSLPGYSGFGQSVSGAGDVNQDGYADVIVGEDATATAYVYTGSSDGLNSAVFAALVGPDDVSGFGYAVAGTGDANGDGYDDVIVGAYGSDYAGAVWVYQGSATGSMTSSTQLGQSDWDLGTVVANAGDVNGDGYDEVIVGASGYLWSTGQALVYHGSASGLSTTAGSTLVGAAPGDSFGYSVAGAGDTNGDGYDDVIVGAKENGWGGAAYTYQGSATGVVSTPAKTISRDSDVDFEFGYLVAGIGDVNHDGYADVAVANHMDAIYTYHGSAWGTSPTAGSSPKLLYNASSVASAGDVNGDGYDDLIIGCEGYTSDVGHAYVYNGSSSGIADAVSRTLTGESSGDNFGHAVAGVGDVDGDGYDDVAVGAPVGEGHVYVYHGASTGLSSSVRTIINGGSSYDFLGDSVAGAGDTEGDGYDDILVGATGYGSTGGLFVYAGSPSGVTSTATTTITGDGWFGSTIAAGDFNGDGRPDFLAGDSSYNYGAGRVSVWYGCVNSDHDAACAADDCDDTDPAITVPYADSDGDGYGDAAAPADTCVAEVGFVWDGTDCDDASAAIHPGAIEICDAADTDEDCDGLADDDDSSVSGTTSGYADDDGDGSGGVAGWYCDGVAASGDCDDAEAASHPGATEVCDHLDNDCDGDIDSDAVNKTTWCADSDGDRFTDPEISAVDCFAPDGYRRESDQPDCDDTDSEVHPGAVDILDDHIDQDCDGSDAGYYYQHKSGICACATTADPSSLALVLIGAAFARRRR